GDWEGGGGWSGGRGACAAGRARGASRWRMTSTAPTTGRGAAGSRPGTWRDMPGIVREFPDAPRVAVGAVVLDGGRVLLVRRGEPASQGKRSCPGGLVELGERLEQAVAREVEEECGLQVKLLGVCGVIDRVVRDTGAEPVRFHWVIVDYAAVPTGGELCAGDDAAEARWVDLSDL